MKTESIEMKSDDVLEGMVREMMPSWFKSCMWCCLARTGENESSSPNC